MKNIFNVYENIGTTFLGEFTECQFMIMTPRHIVECVKFLDQRHEYLTHRNSGNIIMFGADSLKFNSQRMKRAKRHLHV